MDVGANIRRIRKCKGLTQVDVAEMAEIAVNSLRLYEAGKRTPNLEQVQHIARALDVEWLDLVDGDTAAKMTIDHVVGKLQALSTPIERINRDVSQMTQEGQEKVADYAADILPRYKRPAAPQSPPAPQECTDTTPPPEGGEGPQEGEDRGGDEISSPF